MIKGVLKLVSGKRKGFNSLKNKRVKIGFILSYFLKGILGENKKDLFILTISLYTIKTRCHF